MCHRFCLRSKVGIVRVCGVVRCECAQRGDKALCRVGAHKVGIHEEAEEQKTTHGRCATG